MNRLLKDLSIDLAKNPASALHDRWDSEEENEEDGDDGDIIIDRCKNTFRWTPSLLSSPPFLLLAEERGPGDSVDVTRARRHEMKEINWPRPGWGLCALM